MGFLAPVDEAAVEMMMSNVLEFQAFDSCEQEMAFRFGIANQTPTHAWRT